MKAFLDAGGKYDDIDKLKIGAMGDGFADDDDPLAFVVDPLGYMSGIARFDAADIDLSSELLADVLLLTHPDKHPPERKELANRVTQRLLALKPFVFPARTPQEPGPPTTRRSASKEDDDIAASTKERPPRYPCPDCADTIPYFYCDPCKAEHEKRARKEFERRTAKQRAEYKRCRERMLANSKPRQCATCGVNIKRMRADARYCSDTCRQRAHRKAQATVTDKSSLRTTPLTSRDSVWENRILDLLKKHPAVFLNDILPEHRTRAEYQALCLAAVKLECAGKIESVSFLARFSKPGFKALCRLGHKIEHPAQIPRLNGASS